MRSSQSVVGVVCLGFLVAACGTNSVPGEATIEESGGSDSSGEGGASGSGGSEGEAGSNGDGVGVPGGIKGVNLGLTDGSGETCKTDADCEVGQCGPISDGCGDFIACGGCEAPESCGGGGVPSFCGGGGSGGSASGGSGSGGSSSGEETCETETCETLDVACGKAINSCGETLDCPSCGDGTECVLGECQATSSCDLLTCEDDYSEPGRCGAVTNGCSGTLDCGFAECAAGQICQESYCIEPVCPALSCVEALAQEADGYCGTISDGCSVIYTDCAPACPQGESCNNATHQCEEEDTSEGCTTGVTQEVACDGKCGSVGDGCSGTYDCGIECSVDGEVCAANGVANTCGVPECTTRTTCEAQGAECDTISDGCDGTLDCGTACGANQECSDNQCVARTDCMDAAQACSAASVSCGAISDGCDLTVTCGTGIGDGCESPQTCGGNGTAGECGQACVPATCESIGADCGPQGDGCGNQLDCGDPELVCATGEVCQGTPSQCIPDPQCTNFCQQQVTTCVEGSETRITGKVYAPNGSEPLFNALVYVPNLDDLNNLPAIGAGPECLRCEDEDLGEPLVAAITGPDGSFSLDNIPSGIDFPLVVKMGKWRRVVTIPGVAACSDNVLAAQDARLPSHMADAAPELVQHVNIPQFAMVTGQVDAIECVLRKIGLADSEFTGPQGAGRVHMYKGINGANVTGSSATVGALFSDGAAALENYDVALFDCEGPNHDKDAGQQPALEAFANAGGRVFASHFSYSYLESDDSFSFHRTVDVDGSDGIDGWGLPWSSGGSTQEMAESNADTDGADLTTGIIDTSHAKSQAFNAWLGQVGAHHAEYGDGYMSIKDPRGHVRSLNSLVTELFVSTDEDHLVAGHSGTGPQPNGDINVDTAIQQFAFNTPVGAPAENVCGRVVYSAFHVAGNGIPNFNNDTFPGHCASGPLTAQEKALEFMIFDLSACVSTATPPACTPQDCDSLGLNCGYTSDGCGGIQNCGTCEGSDTCGGGGTNNQCGNSCTLTTCAESGATCGTISDGCGGTLTCGDCTAPASCGGGDTANVCGAPSCTPTTCENVGADCGIITDGCGATLNCGTCETSGEFCGGGGANQCGTTSCDPQACAPEECGTKGDGCGGVVQCSTSCESGFECGAGGPNLCGQVCVPETCGAETCGAIGDGCGGVLNCGGCGSSVCGGAGTANVCGPACSPDTCVTEGAECGTLSDGCGGVLSCGSCSGDEVCGASTANQCGAGSCTPNTCGQDDCGTISDGCSGTMDCGTCNGCVPEVCLADNCGPIVDGCGALIDCGICSNGKTCGGGGTANVCGGGPQ